jgi:RNA polymerase sigma-70 factor (ECF subfamily)
LDRAAFRTVFEEHFEHVWHTLRRLGVRVEDLEDLTHEVFVTFYRRRAEYDPARPIRPWLGGIALRVAAAHRRQPHRRAEVLDGGELATGTAGEAPLPDQTLARKQDRALVIDALATVELDRRAVFTMHDLDGAAMPEIARALGIPLNTAYSRLRLAREDFKAAVQRLRLRRR